MQGTLLPRIAADRADSQIFFPLSCWVSGYPRDSARTCRREV